MRKIHIFLEKNGPKYNEKSLKIEISKSGRPENSTKVVLQCINIEYKVLKFSASHDSRIFLIHRGGGGQRPPPPDPPPCRGKAAARRLRRRPRESPDFAAASNSPHAREARTEYTKHHPCARSAHVIHQRIIRAREARTEYTMHPPCARSAHGIH